MTYRAKCARRRELDVFLPVVDDDHWDRPVYYFRASEMLPNAQVWRAQKRVSRAAGELR